PLASLTGKVATGGRLNLYNSITLDFCEGDVDGDGDVDGSDVADLIAAFSIFNPAADFNNDEVVDAQDVPPLAENAGRNDCPSR
ncbi:MAG: hypothetical protein JSW39_15275, partial [Desulfobacterales bacterium]